jgi:hypothetical protein
MPGNLDRREIVIIAEQRASMHPQLNLTESNTRDSISLPRGFLREGERGVRFGVSA